MLTIGRVFVFDRLAIALGFEPRPNQGGIDRILNQLADHVVASVQVVAFEQRHNFALVEFKLGAFAFANQLIAFERQLNFPQRRQ